MSVSEAAIGVLVVHGIGAQKPGEAVGKLIAGLSRVERGFGANGHDGVLTLGGQPVRLYEVYWADLLMGAASRDAFRIEEMQSVTWFPLLNLLRRNYPKGTWSFLKLAWCALPLFNFLLLFAYFGAGMIAEMIKGDRKPSRSIRRTAEDARLKVIKEILGEYVGDVFSYVSSAGNGEGVYDQIVQRFYAQLVKAQADRCAAIHVVAHSLGSVVTYHALSGLGFHGHDAVRAACANVRRVYTIGSPLEKIRVFWPRLTPDAPLLGGSKIEWDNFQSYFDPVAGRLRQVAEWGERDAARALRADRRAAARRRGVRRNGGAHPVSPVARLGARDSEDRLPHHARPDGLRPVGRAGHPRLGGAFASLAQRASTPAIAMRVLQLRVVAGTPKIRSSVPR